MTAMQSIDGFLGLKRFAFVGVSRESKDFSRSLFREFRQRGYDAVPVNPEVKEIEGQPCFARLEEVQPPVEGALLMTPPAVTEKVVRECPAAGIRRVWMFRGAGKGSVSREALAFCEVNSIDVIPGECPFMFLPGAAGFHRFHGLIKKITGKYPK